MNENENQEPGIVRADYLQRFTGRQRMQARMNIRAAKLPPITQAFVYGLDLLALTPLSPPAGMLEDDGGAVLISVTAGGNWSSDGEDSAPLVGPWLKLVKTTAEETVDGETEDDDESFPSVVQSVTHWDIEYWEDGAQDAGFAWQSEKLHADLAEDIFMFRSWRPVPDLENTSLEEDSVAPESTVWLQPIEPEEEPYSRTNPPAWLLPVFEIHPDGTLEMESWFMVPGLEPMSMEIDSYGYLVFTYPDNTTPPDFHISGGNLIVNL